VRLAPHLVTCADDGHGHQPDAERAQQQRGAEKYAAETGPSPAQRPRPRAAHALEAHKESIRVTRFARNEQADSWL
jgi:hypothetical protein